MEHKLARRLLPALRPGCCCWPAVTSPAGNCGAGRRNRRLPAGAWRNQKETWCSRRYKRRRTGCLAVMPAPAGNVRLGQARAAGRSPRPGRPGGRAVPIIRVPPSRSAPLTAPPGPSPFPPGYHAAWITSGTSCRARGPLPPAAGKRERLRRADDPAPRRRVHPALQVTRTGPPGTVRAPHRLPGATRPGSRNRTAGRHRPRPDLLHGDRPRRPRPRRQPRNHHPAQPGPGTPPGHRRPPRRHPPPPAGTATANASRKKPKNNFPAMKRGQKRPPSRVTYKIKVGRETSLPAQTP